MAAAKDVFGSLNGRDIFYDTDFNIFYSCSNYLYL